MLSGGMIPSSSSNHGRMLYMNNFNHLNTIEEEKHETQTSNYYKDGDAESERGIGNESSKFLSSSNHNVNLKGSKILTDLTHDEGNLSNINKDKS